MREMVARIQKKAYLSHGPEVTSSNLEFSTKLQRKFRTVYLCTSNLPTTAQQTVESTIET